LLALNRRTEDIKRQRTTSGSASSNSQSKSRRQAVESEEENQKPERPKNIRGAAARNHRNKEIRDREAQREQERAHASGSKRRTARGRDDGKYSDSKIFQLILMSLQQVNRLLSLYLEPTLPEVPKQTALYSPPLPRRTFHHPRPPTKRPAAHRPRKVASAETNTPKTEIYPFTAT